MKCRSKYLLQVLLSFPHSFQWQNLVNLGVGQGPFLRPEGRAAAAASSPSSIRLITARQQIRSGLLWLRSLSLLSRPEISCKESELPLLVQTNTILFRSPTCHFVPKRSSFFAALSSTGSARQATSNGGGDGNVHVSTGDFETIRLEISVNFVRLVGSPKRKLPA